MKEPFKVGDRTFQIKGKTYLCRRILKSRYWITNCGEVVSTFTETPRILSGGTAGGYKSLTLIINGDKTSYRNHHLVMNYFVGARPRGMVINHKDCNKLNNKLSNLEYCTPKQNRNHAMMNGRYHSGSACSWSKLREQYIPIIFKCYESGMSLNMLARAFGVDKKAVSQVLKNKSWNKVKHWKTNEKSKNW